MCLLYTNLYGIYGISNCCQNILAYSSVYEEIYMVVMECCASCWLEREQL